MRYRAAPLPELSLLPIKKNQFLRPSRSIGMRYRAAPLPELSLLPIKNNQFFLTLPIHRDALPGCATSRGK